MRETPVPTVYSPPGPTLSDGRSSSGSAEWLQRSFRAVWHPCTQMKQHETLPLVAVARGEGAWLYDFDGRRYLDAVSSWWVNLFGHANPRRDRRPTRRARARDACRLHAPAGDRAFGAPRGVCAGAAWPRVLWIR